MAGAPSSPMTASSMTASPMAASPMTTPASHGGPQTSASSMADKPNVAAATPRLCSADDAAPACPTGLRISTDFALPLGPTTTVARRESINGPSRLSPCRPVTREAPSNGISRTPSLRSSLAGGTSSVIPSPLINAMGDMTPLPSPLMAGDSPGPWKRLSGDSSSPPQSRGRKMTAGQVSVFVTNNGESIESATMCAPKRRLYASLDATKHGLAVMPQQHHQHHQQLPQDQTRSASDYVPQAIASPPRPVAVSASHISIDKETQMRRELNFADSRGLTPTVTQPPTPPPSESSKDCADATRTREPACDFFEARSRGDQKLRRWRCIGYLGQGTFSRVMLATSHTIAESAASVSADCSAARRQLVAIKVCEHGPRGGASEERVEMSLKRELEILQSIHHPSLVNLKAWSIEPTRAILVLSYSPGGDLFELATAHRRLLTPGLLRRMFAELVGAVAYLHQRRIVHRDIKLENVLVNLSTAELDDARMDWTTYPTAVVRLTDLGLSRRIADDEKLETRCGSDDYAAPEVIMGQPYDGRATDAWSLGVLLYALLEARLPFDPHPGMSDAHRMRSRTSHRIARVEWRWVEYAGQDGEHEASVAKFEQGGLVGAMEITEGLLKRARSRWSIDQVAAQPWVRGGIQVAGGLQFEQEDEGEEV
ncbi:hypothetical protein CDD82_6596 [Ophiocordyceps australis]|uniref:Protein kinase domain-containing protein n=1 Tax=Ophiocordyceps australis TaxID=1399860 RepID=A0A2C5XG86_9HYPO|nr:hypothetical protein CDD82_6596 [Ophiocordyceps australis]